MKRVDVSSEEMHMVLWSQQRNLVANRDKVKQKIFKICFCSLKLQVFAHLNVKQVWRGEKEPGGTRVSYTVWQAAGRGALGSREDWNM